MVEQKIHIYSLLLPFAHLIFIVRCLISHFIRCFLKRDCNSTESISFLKMADIKFYFESIHAFFSLFTVFKRKLNIYFQSHPSRKAEISNIVRFIYAFVCTNWYSALVVGTCQDIFPQTIQCNLSKWDTNLN